MKVYLHVFCLCSLLSEAWQQQKSTASVEGRLGGVEARALPLQAGTSGQVIVAICKSALSYWEREGGQWDRLRMATQVAQLLLKGLFITVRSLLAPSPLLLPSSILTRPHLNNEPNTKSVWCMFGDGAGGIRVPLIFRTASLLIKAAITS